MRYKIIAMLMLGEELGDSSRCDALMWRRLRAGFKSSVEDNVKKGKLEYVEMKAPDRREGCNYIYTCINEKTRHWAEQVSKLRVPAVLCDVDVIFKHDMDSVFKRDFDVAITRRPGDTWFVSGVMFVKPTAGARRLMKRWAEYTDELYRTDCVEGVPSGVLEARKRTGQLGLNQPALIDLLDGGGFDDVKVIELPSAEYNCCSTDWKSYTADTKIVHVHAKLREHIMRPGSVPRRKAKRWRKCITGISKYYV